MIQTMMPPSSSLMPMPASSIGQLLFPSSAADLDQHSYVYNPKVFPDKGAHESFLLKFRDRVINPWSQYRNMRVAESALWMRYYLGQQWSELDPSVAFDGVRGAIFADSDMDMPAEMPHPVTNEIDPAVEQAVISVAGRQWTFKSEPLSAAPEIKAAAQVATDILQHRLELLRWQEKRHQHAFQFVLSGTGLLFTYQDQDYRRMKNVAAQSAVYCDRCQTKLYSPDVPLASLQAGYDGTPTAFMETVKPVPPDENMLETPEELALNLHRLSYCPYCSDEMSELKPYSPTPHEIEYGDDMYGRAMGCQEPITEPCIEVDDVFSFYPADGGFMWQPDSLRLFGRRKLRHRDWIEERCPHLIDQLPAPEPVTELLYNDPLLGGYDIMSRWSPALDVGILDDHYNVDELVQEPTIRHPLGRYCMMIKDRVLIDDDLLVPAETDTSDDYGDEQLYVPRAQMHVSRFKLRPREIWGSGIAATMISPQNRLNGIDGQTIHARLCLASPNVYMPHDMWVDNPVHFDDEYGAGKFVFFKPSMENPEVKSPEVVPMQTIPDSIYMERDRVKDDLKRAGAPKDATIGEPVKNVGTTSGLQFLVDQDMKAQSLREEELVRSCERAARHVLQIEWLRRTNKESYRVFQKDKSWSYQQYTGEAIRGQIETRVVRGAPISKGVIEREAAREALADKLFDTSSPLTRRKLLNAYGLDPDLVPEMAYHTDHADRVWVDWKKKGIVRVQDTLDDAVVHYLVLQHHLRTEEGEQLADNVNWDAYARAFAGWQDELRVMEIADQKVIAFYGGRVGPEQGKKMYGEAVVRHDEEMAVYEEQEKNREKQTEQAESGDPLAAAALGAQPPPLPPNEPPPPQFLPALLQDKILLVWLAMAERNKVPLQQGSPAFSFVQFRSLVEAYRLTATGWAEQIKMEAETAMAPPTDPSAQSGAPPTSSPAPSPSPVASKPEGGAN